MNLPQPSEDQNSSSEGRLIQRYEVTSHPGTRQPEMVPSPNPLGGGYVRFADHQAELEEVKGELEAARKELRRPERICERGTVGNGNGACACQGTHDPHGTYELAELLRLPEELAALQTRYDEDLQAAEALVEHYQSGVRGEVERVQQMADDLRSSDFEEEAEEPQRIADNLVALLDSEPQKQREVECAVENGGGPETCLCGHERIGQHGNGIVDRSCLVDGCPCEGFVSGRPVVYVREQEGTETELFATIDEALKGPWKFPEDRAEPWQGGCHNEQTGLTTEWSAAPLDEPEIWIYEIAIPPGCAPHGAGIDLSYIGHPAAPQHQPSDVEGAAPAVTLYGAGDISPEEAEQVEGLMREAFERSTRGDLAEDLVMWAKWIGDECAKGMEDTNRLLCAGDLLKAARLLSTQPSLQGLIEELEKLATTQRQIQDVEASKRHAGQSMHPPRAAETRADAKRVAYEHAARLLRDSGVGK